MNLFEIGILDFVQTHMRSTFGDLVMPLITVLGDGGIFWILLTLALLVVPKTRKLGLCCAVSLLIDLALCNGLLKNLIARTRPYDVNPAVRLLIEKPGEFSFPSGHAAASFTVVGAMYFSKSRLWIPSAVLAAVIGFSRIYLYVHYPTDVIGGAAFGLLFGLIGAAVTDKILRFMQEKRAGGGHNAGL